MPIAMVRIKRPAAIANLPGAGVRFSVWRNKRDVVENGDSHPINVVTGRFFEKVVILCTQMLVNNSRARPFECSLARTKIVVSRTIFTGVDGSRDGCF